MMDSGRDPREGIFFLRVDCSLVVGCAWPIGISLMYIIHSQ